MTWTMQRFVSVFVSAFSQLIHEPQWTEILPRVSLGPSQRHLFKIPETARVTFVKLNMYPDGGIVRFVSNCSKINSRV
jgi:allantoicase